MPSEPNPLTEFARQWGYDKWRSEDNEHLKDRFWADLVRHGYTIGGRVGAELFSMLYDATLVGRKEHERDRGIAQELRKEKKGYCPYMRKELFAQVCLLIRMSRINRLSAQQLLATAATFGRR